MNSKKAILLINLGTPKTPTAQDVGPYLTEFLTDPDVIDVPYLIRQYLVRLLIVPKRKYASAQKYQTIWTERGSPLMFHTQDITNKLREKIKQIKDIDDVFFAMRYGEPSIKNVLSTIKENGYEQIIVMPLYPQETKSSVGTTIKKVNKEAQKLGIKASLTFTPSFYQENFYIESLARSIKEHPKSQDFEYVLFSYHGIPAHHLPSSCLDGKKPKDCTVTNEHCYRYQCFETSRLVAKALGLKPEQFSTSFQSRLGNRPWVKPYTDLVIEDIGKKHKNIAVVTPSFIADCLETIEEIGMELKEDFEKLGDSHELTRIECVNDSDYFIDSLSRYFTDKF